MKSYKISQTIEKNLYPIEAKLDEIRESNRKNLRQFLDIYAPVFISAVLTAAFGGSIVSNSVETAEDVVLTFWERVFHSWFGKSLCILVVFVIFAFVIFFICKILHIIADRRDNKGTSNKRNQIAKVFYKVIIPEIITGVSLFERAYEIELAVNGEGDEVAGVDAEDIHLDELDGNQPVRNKAILYYYESFYHFKLVAEGLDKEQIIECKDSERENLKKLYEVIGVDALKKAIGLCRHCVREICKRIEDADEENLCRLFDDYNRNLLDK
jgi:large-conductance mechanosensitive channel